MKLAQLLANNYTQSQVRTELNSIREDLEGELYGGGVREETGEKGTKELRGLVELEKQVENLPRLRLTLAFKPEEKQIAEIGSWVREKVNKRALLDLRVDKNLIAGARVVWQSRAADFSLKSKLTAKHGEIKELLLS